MEAFKIAYFERDHPDRKFPTFESLGPQECRDIRRRLTARLLLGHEGSGKELLHLVHSLQETIPEVNADDDEFVLKDVLGRFHRSEGDVVYINWIHFDRIDRMSMVDLSAYFGDVWYPSSDDIDLFDEAMSWMLSIRHDGCLLHVRLCEK